MEENVGWDKLLLLSLLFSDHSVEFVHSLVALSYEWIIEGKKGLETQTHTHIYLYINMYVWELSLREVLSCGCGIGRLACTVLKV